MTKSSLEPRVKMHARLLALSLLASVALGGLALPHPASAALESLKIWANDPDGEMTTTVLQAHATYLIKATGWFSYHHLSGWRGDAECTDPAIGTPYWQRHRYASVFSDFLLEEDGALWFASTDLFDPDPQDDPIDLYIDNRNWEWIPGIPGKMPKASTKNPDGLMCDIQKNTYYTYFSPAQTGPVNLRIYDIKYEDNSGYVSVTIEPYRNAPPIPAHARLLETVVVYSTDSDGVQSQEVLEDGVSYLLLAHGMYIYGIHPQYLADAECARKGIRNEATIVEDSMWSSQPYTKDGLDMLDVLLDEQIVSWMPFSRSVEAGCDRSGYYSRVVTGAGEKLSLRILDDYYFDNAGNISVDVFELTTIAP